MPVRAQHRRRRVRLALTVAVGGLLATGSVACTAPEEPTPGPSTRPTPVASPTATPTPTDEATSVVASPTALPSPFDTATWTSAVPYGPDPSQVLDVHVPDAAVPSPTGDPDRRPAMVLVHGGGWTGGDRISHHTTGTALVALGWVAVSVGYRLAPDHPHPAAADDVRAALEFVHDRATTLGIDPDRVVLAGDSAGGHLTGLVALADERPPVAAWVAWSGVYDLPGLAARLQPSHDWLLDAGGAYLGCDQPTDDDCLAAARAASPVTHASADDPPTILLHSTDELVPLEDAEAMRDALDDAGARVVLEVFEGAAHGVNLVLPASDAVRAFLEDVLDLTS